MRSRDNFSDSVTRACSIGLMAAVFFCWSGPAVGYATPEWFYQVEMPVADQSEAERSRVAAAGLLRVLTRASGLSSVPRNAPVREALERPAGYYNEFVFFDREGGLHLRINFTGEAILDLLHRARLPIWWTQRPTVLVWLVLEENGQRQIMSAGQAHPLREALLEAGRARGLELQFPIMDLTDQLAISGSDIWGRLAHSLDAASARYAPDMVWTGRLRASLSASRGLDVRGDFSFWIGDQVYTSAVQETRYPAVAERAMGYLADGLTTQYAVPARAPAPWQFQVAALDTVGDYKRLMAYLEGFDFLSGVQVVRVQDDVLSITANTAADESQLLRLLTAQKRLRVNHLHRGVQRQFLWQADAG